MSHFAGNDPKSPKRFWLTLAALLAIAAGVIWIVAPAKNNGSSAPTLLFSEVRADPVSTKVEYWPASATKEEDAWTGRLERIDQHLALLSVRGTAEERGSAHGRLLKVEIQRLVRSVRAFLEPAGSKRGQFAQCLEGAAAMKKHLDPKVLVELEACAAAAEVDAGELLLAQLFGDVNRAKGFASFCSSFAAFGPATAGGKLIFGRNFDYAGHGLEGGLPVVLQEIPKGPGEGFTFITVGYAGILNGWTAMNVHGLSVSNNTLFGGVDSMEGVSTCFLLRSIAEHARSVEEGVALIEKSPRACTTGMLIAGKNAAGSWDARLVEFDAKAVAVVEPKDGLVLGTNTRQKLAVGGSAPVGEPGCGRFQELKRLVLESKGKLSLDEPANRSIGARGVYMGINLHSALLYPDSQQLRLAISPGDGTPAAEHPFRDFKVEAQFVRLVN